MRKLFIFLFVAFLLAAQAGCPRNSGGNNLDDKKMPFLRSLRLVQALVEKEKTPVGDYGQEIFNKAMRKTPEDLPIFDGYTLPTQVRPDVKGANWAVLLLCQDDKVLLEAVDCQMPPVLKVYDQGSVACQFHIDVAKECPQ